MRCPSCERLYSDSSLFPIQCSCRTRFGADGEIISARKGSSPVPRQTLPSISAPEPVGTHLASLIPDWAKSMKGGCGCKNWELKMNRWGVRGCEERREQIVSHLMSQQEHLAKPLQALPDVLKRVAAGKLVDLAIKRSIKD